MGMQKFECRECGKVYESENEFATWFKDPMPEIMPSHCDDCTAKRIAELAKADFEEMIRDWQADRAPEMDDLEIDAIDNYDGKFVATAHDSKNIYSLADDGTGNIRINYLGTRR